jgi:hypothetical protein
MHRARPFFLYSAVFLIAASGLMLEVALTRIFSATIWYHYTFITISVALLGWGLGGFFLHALRVVVAPSPTWLVLLCIIYACAIPLSLILIVRLPFSPEHLSFYFAAAGTPFLLAGMVLATAFDLFSPSSHRLYAADLVGASLGTVAVTLLLHELGGERTTLAIAILPLLAAFCFATLSPERTRRRFTVPALLSLTLAVFLFSNFDIFKIREAPAKGLYQHRAEDPQNRKIAMTRWNAYSRIDALEGLPAPWLARLYIDSDAWTNVHAWDGKPESLTAAMSELRYLPYHLVRRPNTLIIGPGGGFDVLVAIAGESERVTAVEMNPIMIDFVRHYGAKAGNLYDHPRVKVILDEGRHFVRHTGEKFDVILLGFVDSWASVSSGGLALSENYLYTTEAFRDFHEHLSEAGVLAFARWQVDIPRMVANAVALFDSPEEAGEHTAILLEKQPRADQPTAMLFLLKKEKFTEAETALLERLSKNYFVVHLPGRHTESPYAELFSAKITPAQFHEAFDAKADPVTDDRPFYFANEKPYGIPRFLLEFFRELLSPLGILCLLMIGWAMVNGRGRRWNLTSAVLYFGSLGIGFIVLELALMQRLILLLGHPIFTLAVILFSLLVSCGVGSFLSGRARDGSLWIQRVSLAIAGLGLAYAFFLPSIVHLLLHLPLAARIASVIAIVFPLGLLMGMPFPLGLRGTSWFAKGPAFFWGLNGIASVVGSIAAVLISVVFGFGTSMAVGSLLYLVPVVTARWVVPSKTFI